MCLRSPRVALALGGSHWISPHADGSGGTSATYQVSFVLPAAATDASLSISLYADNQANQVSLNGSSFGGQQAPCDEANFNGAPSSLTTSDGLVAGANTLTIHTTNCDQTNRQTALDFVATVSYQPGRGGGVATVLPALQSRWSEPVAISQSDDVRRRPGGRRRCPWRRRRGVGCRRCRRPSCRRAYRPAGTATFGTPQRLSGNMARIDALQVAKREEVVGPLGVTNISHVRRPGRIHQGRTNHGFSGHGCRHGDDAKPGGGRCHGARRRTS